MKEAFGGLISKLDMPEERISELMIRQYKLPNQKVERKKSEKNIKFKNCGQLQK